MKCWSCEQELITPIVICASCGVPQKLDTLDPFSLFALTPQFQLDLDKLDQQYFALQRQVHPDHFVTSTPIVKEHAAQGSMHLNKAYQALKDPLKRAHALYTNLKGTLTETSVLEPAVLEEMMELQEMLIEDKDRGLEKVEHQQDQCLEAIGQAFDNHVDQVPGLLERYSYLQRLKG